MTHTQTHTHLFSQVGQQPDAQSCVSRTRSLGVPCAEPVHTRRYLLTCTETRLQQYLSAAHTCTHTELCTRATHSPMYSLYQRTCAHKHVEPVHTEPCTPMCAVSYISTHACLTQSHAHICRACAYPQSTELCIDPLTPECAIQHTHMQLCTQRVCTSAHPHTQCCAHQHTQTLCKAGPIQSHLGTPETTQHAAMHTDTCVLLSICVHTEPCTLTRVYTQSHAH